MEHIENQEKTKSYWITETIVGFTMRTFKMDLEYEKLYRFINMRTSYLPRSKGDMGVLKATLRSCNQLKVGSLTSLRYNNHKLTVMIYEMIVPC